MATASWRVQVEKMFFGVSLDDVLEQLRLVGRSVDDVSARLDRDMATLRKGIRKIENAVADDRDGLFIVEDDCISCHVCVDVAPSTFRMKDDGIAEVFEPYGSGMEKLKEAIDSCGGSCIKLA